MANTWAELSTKATYSKEDCVDGPILVTVKSFGEKTFKDENGDDGDKIKAIFVEESDRVVPLKPTIREFLMEKFKNPNDAIGQVIELYHDPEVRFGGKKTGGLRVRLPTGKDVF